MQTKEIRKQEQQETGEEGTFNMAQLDNLCLNVGDDPFGEFNIHFGETNEKEWMNWALSTLETASRDNVKIQEDGKFEFDLIEQEALDEELEQMVIELNGLNHQF